MKILLVLTSFLVACHAIQAQPGRRQFRRPMAYATDSIGVHDPVMAYERGMYYLLSTGNGLQWATSADRRTWVVQPTPFIQTIPEWTRDSVPGFRSHVWAPDVIRWHNRWWLAYSCSTFGKNTSAIGLMSAARVDGEWKDEGCLVASKENRDNWNAIDPAFIIDTDDQPWLTWGSFWDGIQLARLDTTMHIAGKPVTIARRHGQYDTNAPENPTSRFAGRNAIEAPFILRHGGYYYLFVSWDYCCRGAQSNYRVAVGRSEKVEGPYLDRTGKAMTEGGGELFIEGDKKEYEAAGHSAAYDLPTGETLFICHGYSATRNGASILVQRPVTWTADGWPVLKE